MIPISSPISRVSSAVSGSLTWSKISCMQQHHELKLNGELVGSLRKPSFWSSEFEAETQSGRWTIRKAGFCGTGAAIVDAASQQTIATSKSSWGGRGTLTFADGQVFEVLCNGWWRPVWSVLTESGQTLLRIYTREKTVDLSTGAANGAAISNDRLAMLIMFTWYCVLRAEEDASAALMVAAVS
jgi:hypothetical protein